MRLKTFRAFTLDEALDAVHDDLGEDAAILHTRTFRKGGLLGLGGREVVEVIASEAEPGSSILPAVGVGSDVGKPVADPVPGGPATDEPSVEEASAPIAAGSLAGRAARLYGVEQARSSDSSIEPSTTPSEPVEPAPSSGTLEVDRDRTRALARAMEIRLERQQAARAAAGVTGPDDLVGDHADATPSEPPISPADTTPDTTPETMATSPEVAAETFTIAPGGLLVPESRPEDGLADTPRVVELEVESIAPSTDGGIPTALPVESSAEPEPELETGPAARDAEQELRQLGEVVGRVLDPDAPRSLSTNVASSGHGDPLASAYAELIAQEFSKDLADRVVGSLESRLDTETSRNHEVVRRMLLEEIADLVPTEESIETVVPRDGRPRTIAFVGPTGVGKTTTLAKIAATLSIRDGLKVAMVTADTYRISAVDQLRTYAEILGCHLEVAGDAASMKTALENCRGVDAILIDTPGRSQNDADSLAELRTIMDAARPHETHLVLSGTASERVLVREAEAFAGLGPDRVVLTKLDEAVAFGMLVSVVRRIGRRISWVTTGQEVPRDVEWATGSRIADLVLGGAVKS